MQRNGFSGGVKLAQLPPALETLHLAYNAFNGEVNLRQLAHVPLKILNLAGNAFTGALDFTHLPGTLKEFSVAYNKFCGDLDLQCLPKALCELSLQGNEELCGEVRAEHLPEHLRNHPGWGDTKVHVIKRKRFPVKEKRWR